MTDRRAHFLTRLGRLAVNDNDFEAAWPTDDTAEELLGDEPGRDARPPPTTGWS